MILSELEQEILEAQVGYKAVPTPLMTRHKPLKFQELIARDKLIKDLTIQEIVREFQIKLMNSYRYISDYSRPKMPRDHNLNVDLQKAIFDTEVYSKAIALLDPYLKTPISTPTTSTSTSTQTFK